MSGVWSSILNLDLTIPSNGSLTPGSGNIYIGGPQLPPTLPANFKGALIFYSDPIGLSQGVDYWYIAHFSDATSDGLEIGYYPTGGPSTVRHSTQFFQNNFDHNVNETVTGIATLQTKTGLVQIKNLSAYGNAIQIQTPGRVQISNDGTGKLIEFSNQTDPVIKAGNAPNIDQWLTDTSTQTILNATAGGVAGCTVKCDWRVTVDRLVEFRSYVTIPGPGLPASGQYTWFNAPAVFAALTDSSPSGGSKGPYVTGNYYIGGTNGYGCINGRIDGNTVYFFNVPAGVTSLELGGVFTTVKP
jgi:hypothetical protein